MPDFGPPGSSPGNWLYDHRICLVDDCTGTFDYSVSGTGGDDVHTYAANTAWYGAAGAVIKTRVTGAADGDQITIEKSVSPPIGDKLVFKIRITSDDVSAIDHAKLWIKYYDGAKQYAFQLRWRPNTPDWSYYNSAAGQTALTIGTGTPLDYEWFNVELQMDLSTHQYIKAVINGQEQDLTEIDCYEVGAATNRMLNFSIYLEANAGAPADLQFDMLYLGEYDNP